MPTLDRIRNLLSDAAARAIYDRSGFLHDATFIAGTLDVPHSARGRLQPVRNLATAS